MCLLTDLYNTAYEMFLHKKWDKIKLSSKPHQNSRPKDQFTENTGFKGITQLV